MFGREGKQGSGRGLAGLIGLLVALAVGGVAFALTAGRERDGSQTTTHAARELEPVLVPFRRHPQVVEPAAGDVNGVASGSAEIPTAPPPRRGSDAGPSSGAPSDAEVRRSLTQLQTAARRYHFDQLDFSGALIDPRSLPAGQWQTSVASVFTDYGLPTACGGPLRPNQLGVAHKTLPCGTLVTFRYGNRAIRVPVMDRGPYIAGREWDLTGATAAALGFPGLGFIDWRLN